MNTVRLRPELREKVDLLARKKGVSVSQIHREALEAYCDAELKTPGTSRYDDVTGVIDGPEDLAENAGRRFAEALAEKHARHSH